MLAELIKLASTLDSKSEFELASEVDAVVAELAQRAGIADLIAVANYLDEAGEHAAANQLDAVLAGKKKG